MTESALVPRYRDAYRVAAAIVGLGNAIKAVGAILGGLILFGAFVVSTSSTGQFGGGLAVGGMVGGVFFGAVVGTLSWVCGVIVSAQGQILRATLDRAVAASPFMNDYERLGAMGLPATIGNRSPHHS
jgi:hypothetical protein